MKKRRLFSFLLLLVLLAGMFSVPAFADGEEADDTGPFEVHAKAAILLDMNTDRIIYEKNLDERVYPASLTKIMTCLVALENGNLSDIVTIDEGAFTGLDGNSSTAGLQVGEQLSFNDLLYCLMLSSGNEAANAVAEHIAGSIPDFVRMMNERAYELGCTGTHFVNPHGLHNEEHYTTVNDLVLITKAALKSENFKTITNTAKYELPATNLSEARTLKSTNMLIDNTTGNSLYYKRAIGIKTGFTNAAGHCFVGAAERDGVELISVVFYTTADGRWTDTVKLMEYGFSQFVSMTPAELYAENPIMVETSGFSLDDEGYGRLELNVQARSGSREVSIVATKAEMESMARNLRQTVLIEYTRDFAAPIQAGEVMGTMTYYPTDGGSPVTYDLVASRTIARRENAPLSLEEIVEQVYADPNPFPPLSAELVVMIFLPVGGVFVAIRILMRVFRRTGRHRKGRVPRPRNRFYR